MRILIILMSLVVLSCSTNKFGNKEAFNQSIENKEPGKCYFSLKIDSNEELKFKKAMVLEIKNPVFVKTNRTFEVAELLANNQNRSIVQIETRKRYLEYKFYDYNFDELNYERDTGYVYCFIEQPSQYKTFELDSIKTNQLEVEVTELIEPTSIKYIEVNKRPNKLNDNQFYMESGRWTGEKELVGSTGCFVNIYISMLKKH